MGAAFMSRAGMGRPVLQFQDRAIGGMNGH
ncbi:hypothetical protein GGQ71_002818 [Rhizobium taibaishanense]|uniref:Uncharacterized protein n=1 Tax=Allorhizobium taibaishanense TaxID=887144 RepID=A0A7W6MUV8_9HYPH|nr:hypothetical protein [Allorhizobium taibaishanense]